MFVDVLIDAFVFVKVRGHDPRRAELGYGPPRGRRGRHVGLAEQVEGPRRLPVGVRQVSSANQTEMLLVGPVK